MQEEYSPDILTLSDEDGNEHVFEVIDAIDYNDKRYMAVIPYQEGAQALEEDADLIIMRVDEENGEEFLDIVDDDEELYDVGGVFAERLEEFYDVEE